MQRLYFNFGTSDVRLVPVYTCPPIEEETVFPNADLPDDVTLDMISFKVVDGRIEPHVTYPSIPTTTTATAQP